VQNKKKWLLTGVMSHTQVFGSCYCLWMISTQPEQIKSVLSKWKQSAWYGDSRSKTNHYRSSWTTSKFFWLMSGTRCASKAHPTASDNSMATALPVHRFWFAWMCKRWQKHKNTVTGDKKGNAYCLFNQQSIVHHEESQGQTLHWHFYA